jgi:hypothetical protein
VHLMPVHAALKTANGRHMAKYKACIRSMHGIVLRQAAHTPSRSLGTTTLRASILPTWIVWPRVGNSCHCIPWEWNAVVAVGEATAATR